MKLAFLAHPVGPYVMNGVAYSLASNLENAAKWARICIQEGFPTILPYYELCMALDDRDPTERDMGMAIGAEVLRRCNLLILAGPKFSSGMQQEFSIAQENHIPYIRIIGYTEEEARIELRNYKSWLQ